MKIKNLYNLTAFDRFSKSHLAAGFQDAYAGVVLARHLTSVDPRILEKRYPDLSFLNSGITADNSGGFANNIETLRLVDQGSFKTSGDASGNKGRISLTGEDSLLPVVGREAESIWGETEAKQAEMGNVNLPQRYLETHNKIYLQEVDQAGLLGVPDRASSKGLLNNSLFDASAATGVFSGLTGRQMYDEVATLLTSQHTGVNNTGEYMANRVQMPVSVMNLLMSKMVGINEVTMSVLTALKANFPAVEFLSTFRAAGAGTGDSDVMVAYSNSEEVMKMRIPVPLTIGEIIKLSSFAYKADSMYRIGGLDILESSGGRILTGV